MGLGGFGNLSYLPRPAPHPFNFLNGTGMGIVLNKWGGVGMEATRPELAPLSFLLKSGNKVDSTSRGEIGRVLSDIRFRIFVLSLTRRI